MPKRLKRNIADTSMGIPFPVSVLNIISSSKGASSKTVLLYILPLDNENQIHFEGGKFVSPEEIEADEHNYSSFLKEEIGHLDVVAQMWKEFK